MHTSNKTNDINTEKGWEDLRELLNIPVVNKHTLRQTILNNERGSQPGKILCLRDMGPPSTVYATKKKKSRGSSSPIQKKRVQTNNSELKEIASNILKKGQEQNKPFKKRATFRVLGCK